MALRAPSASWVGLMLAGNRYQVTSSLGAGGMGLVYLARDRNLDTDVVIKVPQPALLRESGFAARFALETRSLVRLSHPHVVKITEVGEHEGVPFAVLQYLGGGTLRQRQQSDRNGQPLPMALETVRIWLPAVAGALDFIHQQGYVHRDVKPDNILFDTMGHAYLSDFGIAKAVGGDAPGKNLTILAGGQVLGTAQYMAPELRAAKPYDGRADQYALAVTVHELLSGRFPFDPSGRRGLPLATLAPHLPAALCQAVERGLSGDARARFDSCQAFALAVVASVRQSGSPQTTLGPVPGFAAIPQRTDPDARSGRPGTGPAAPGPAGVLPTMAQAIRALCTQCKAKLKFPASYQGKRVTCPTCGLKFVAPLSSQAAATQMQVGAAGTGVVQELALETPRPQSTGPQRTGPTPARAVAPGVPAGAAPPRRSRRLKLALCFGALGALVVGAIVALTILGGNGDEGEKRAALDPKAEAERRAEEAKVKLKAAEVKATEEMKAKLAEAAEREAERFKKEAEAKATAELARIKEEAEAKVAAELARIKMEAEAKAKEEVARIKMEAEAKAAAELTRLKEEAERKVRDFEELQRFSSAELEEYRARLGPGDTLGRNLLRATHPTGNYSFTEGPSVTRSADSKTITVRLTVHWRGGILDNPYITIFAFNVTKLGGYDRLIVERDTAIIRIAAENLQQADAALRAAHKR